MSDYTSDIFVHDELKRVAVLAAQTLLESHLETGINIGTWHDIQPLIQNVYPGADYPAEGQLFIRGVDIFRLEVTQIHGSDIRTYAVGVTRMKERIEELMSLESTSYVTVVREERS